MTPEETRAAGQLMLDWADQQFDVQSQPRHWANGPTLQTVWADTKDPQWNWHEFCYRCKPTANLRPYTAEECVGLVGCQVTLDGNGVSGPVAKVTVVQGETHLTIAPPGSKTRVCTPPDLLRWGKFTDGSPCGVEE